MTQDVRPSAPPLAIRVGFAEVSCWPPCMARPGASAHRALPQIEYQGGKVVSSAQIVSVTFAGDPMTSDLQAFGQTVTSSSWWNAVRTEYCAADAGNCVGDGPAGTPVALTTSAAPSYTDSDVGAPSSLQAWLSSAFASGVLPQPTAALAAIYVLYVPGTTSASILDGRRAASTTWLRRVPQLDERPGPSPSSTCRGRVRADPAAVPGRPG